MILKQIWACFRNGHQMSPWCKKSLSPNWGHIYYYKRHCLRCALRREYTYDTEKGPVYRTLVGLLEAEREESER